MIYRQCRKRGTDKPHVLPGSILILTTSCSCHTEELFPIDPPPHFSHILLSACSLKASLASELHIEQLSPAALTSFIACEFWVGTLI